MNVIEIFINEPVNAQLDMDSNLDIALQYSIADIRDISKRNSAYSKTVILPGTKNNNFWFGNLFDVNADFTAFNPNKKTTVKLVVNGEIVLSGFLQLRNIQKLNNVDQAGNEIRYETVLYNNAVDLMTELGEKTCDELDLSRYSHVFNKTNFEASWTHTWEDGYVYPIYGEYDKNYQYNLDWFYPNAFYKAVLDQLITEAGYGWTGSFKDNEQFEKEIISFVKDGNKYVDETEAERRKFRAGITSDNEIKYNRTVVSYANGWPMLYSNPINANVTSDLRAIIRYEDDTTPPNFDNDNSWSTTAWEWTAVATGTYNLKWGAYYDFTLENETAESMNASLSTSDVAIDFYHYVETSIDGGVTWTTLASKVIPNQGFGSTIAANNGRVTRTILVEQTDIPEQQYLIGQKVRVTVYPRQKTINAFQAFDPPGTSAKGPRVYIKWRDDERNYIENDTKATEIGQGSTVDVSFFLPDKLKQKDLISDLIKRYNLFIEVSPDNDRLLIFTERPNFYSDSSPTLDWTQKKDFSQKDNIALLSELQFKELLWTYKQDKDLANDLYQRETGDTYGQQEFIFDNDFVKGVKKIESPFASTPTVQTEWGAYLPSIDPQEPKIMPRVLYYGGLRNDGVGWELEYVNLITGQPQVETYNQYPYSGHFDDPLTPRLDINFGVNKFYFYEGYDILPTNNMYNTYWSDYVRQIEDGKLLTTYLYLDETDIRFIKDNFDTKIFLVDSYYYVNKITDYKPLQDIPTRVELIKIDDGITWVDTGAVNENIYVTASCPNDLVLVRGKTGYFYQSESGQTITEECCDLMGGIWNDVSSTCRYRKPIRPVYAEGIKIKQELQTDGNIGGGIIYGTKNSVGGTRTKQPYEEWILVDGTWNDNLFWVDDAIWYDTGSQSTGYYYTEESKPLIIGNDNTVYGFDIMSLGNNNQLIGDRIFNMGEGNFVNANDTFIFAYDNATFSLPGYAYFGPSFSINTNDGSVTAVRIDVDKLGLTYGTSEDPSLQWYDGFQCGFWKAEGERQFNAGVQGITISTWDSKGINMNDKTIEEHRFNWRRAINSTTVTDIDYVIELGGTNTGITVSLPADSNSGRFLYIKNLMASNIDIGVETNYTITGSSKVIDNFINNGGSLQIDTNLAHGYATGSYVYVSGSGQYSGPYQITSIDSTLLFTVNTSYIAGPAGGETVAEVTYETIDGTYTSVVLSQYDSLTLCSKSSGNWIII